MSLGYNFFSKDSLTNLRPEEKKVLPLSFEKLDEQSKTLNNYLVACSRPIELQMENVSYYLSLYPYQATSQQSTDETIWVKLLIEGKTVWLNFEQWSDDFINNSSIETLLFSGSRTIKTLAAEVLIAPFFEWIEDKFKSKVVVVDVKKINTTFELPLICTFKLQGANQSICCGKIMLSASLEDQFFELLSNWNEVNRYDFDHLELTSPLYIGRTMVTLIDLKELEVGDVVLFEHDLYSNNHAMLAKFGSDISATLKIEEDKIMVQYINEDDFPDEIPREQRSNQVFQSPLEESVDEIIFNQNTVVNSLEVNLDFDLGSISLPIANLKQLQPGYIISLDRTVMEGVRITCNGQYIGNGELVDVEGNTGVKLLEVNGK